jgi:hypothetical protein
MTMQPVIHDLRQFQLWAYAVGMRRLLLRSNQTESNPTRIDVLFQGVRAINLPTSVNGLRISEAREEEQRRISGQTGLLADDDNRFYVVSGQSFSGYVIASLCVEIEDDGSYDDPSELWPDTESSR